MLAIFYVAVYLLHSSCARFVARICGQAKWGRRVGPPCDGPCSCAGRELCVPFVPWASVDFFHPAGHRVEQILSLGQLPQCFFFFYQVSSDSQNTRAENFSEWLECASLLPYLFLCFALFLISSRHCAGTLQKHVYIDWHVLCLRECHHCCVQCSSRKRCDWFCPISGLLFISRIMALSRALHI